jgi:hypothetical protein
MTDDGKTPLTIAQMNQDTAMEAFLRGWGAKKIDVFSIAEDQIKEEEEQEAER